MSFHYSHNNNAASLQSEGSHDGSCIATSSAIAFDLHTIFKASWEWSKSLCRDFAKNRSHHDGTKGGGISSSFLRVIIVRIGFLVCIFRLKFSKSRYYNYYNPKRSETQTMYRAKYTEPGMIDTGGGLVGSSSPVVPLVRGSNHGVVGSLCGSKNAAWNLNSLKFGENS